MNFGQALEALKKGRKVAREGWNGKGLWVKLVKYDDFMSYPTPTFASRSELYDYDLQPFFVIKNAQDSLNTWVPSVSDLLAEDWVIST